MDIEGILSKVRTALVKLADDPSNHCSDCAKELPILPLRIEPEEMNKPESPWKVGNWSFAGCIGWVRISSLDWQQPDRIFCPDCAKKRALV